MSDDVGFVVDKEALGQVLSFSFPCQFSFHQLVWIH
jgi:hypothetical protein